ncbi:MAG: SDR family NAD(P)-dependent oxidoreductase [Sporichthyaceae bacterium]
MKLTARRTLLTGAGSGIGRALALELADRGGRLVLVGRRNGPLEETAALVAERGGRAHVVASDLRADGEPDRVVAAAAEALGGLDLLVNNAGNVRAGRLEDAPAEDLLAMLELNLVVPVLLTRAALPHLKQAAAHGDTGILGVASGIALVALPFYATYAATKGGLARFDEALRRELGPDGIHVATAYPGATDTEMMSSSDAGDDLGFGRRPVLDVAADIIAGLEAGDHDINTALPERRTLQELNAADPLAVDRALAPRLAALEEATRSHRSI